MAKIFSFISPPEYFDSPDQPVVASEFNIKSIFIALLSYWLIISLMFLIYSQIPGLVTEQKSKQALWLNLLLVDFKSY